MALRYSLDEETVANKIDTAIKKFIQQGFRTKDIATTSEVAEKIIEILENE